VFGGLFFGFEVDAYLDQAEELRGLLNAGHKRGACAYRCDGEGNAVRAFKAFAPAVLAGIGALPGTLADRSISILLVEAEPGEIPTRFDVHRIEIETDLCRKLARWTEDNFAALQACDPVLPATAFNRLADNWRPLFAIAQTAGGDWPRLALDAFTRLSTKAPLAAPESNGDGNGAGPITNGVRTLGRKSRSIGTASLTKTKDEVLDLTLLADIRQIFVQSGSTRMSSKELLAALCALRDGHWHSAFCTPRSGFHWLARQLSGFGIASHTMRIGGQRSKGYELADFEGAFSRFLDDGD